MELKETPERIVEDKRIAEYGAFRTPFEEINMSEARIAVAGREMPGLYGRMRLKEWQHFGVVSDDFYFGFAIVDARYLGNSFCYFLDRNTGKMVEHDRIAPPGIAKVARELWEGVCHFRFFGYDIRVDNRLNESRHHLEVDIKGSTKNPSITAEIEVTEDLEKTQPLVLVSPLKGERPSYTHKVACPAEGEIKFGGMPYSFDRDTGVALIDVTKTFFPYNTFWNWATVPIMSTRTGSVVFKSVSLGVAHSPPLESIICFRIPAARAWMLSTEITRCRIFRLIIATPALSDPSSSSSLQASSWLSTLTSRGLNRAPRPSDCSASTILFTRARAVSSFKEEVTTGLQLFRLPSHAGGAGRERGGPLLSFAFMMGTTLVVGWGITGP